jgi:hypothetical protein
MYDSSCYELAELFLMDEPELANEANTKELAQAIQDAIEDFIENARQARTETETEER